LSPELELELVVATEGGDQAACTRLVDAFMPAIGSVARRYRGSPRVNRTELMQEGVVGLLRAAKRFDPQMGTPFWGYASWWVRQAMQQLVSEMTGPVVLSDRAQRHLAKLREARREHLSTHGREPSASELVVLTGLSQQQIDSLLTAERTPRGLEETLGGEEGGETTLGELVADPEAEEEYERIAVRVEVESLPSLSAGLDQREREVVDSHYGLGRPAQTLREIGSRLDLSIERVRQIEAGALVKMREAAAA
jgi:RNA polymerase sigma factor (sigma-70 family)